MNKVVRAKYPMKLNIQYFASAADTVLMSDSKTGSVPTEQANLIMADMVQGSAVMALAKNEPMTKPKKEFTYLAEGVGAYWVDEGNKIPVSKPTWLKATMEAKKLGVIVVATKEALKWSVPTFFNEMRSEIAKAFLTTFDLAALFGVNSPYATGQNVLAAATAAGNNVPFDSAGDVYQQVNAVIEMVEDNDIDPDGIATRRKFKAKLRGFVDGNGRPLFNEPRDGATNDILGLPIAYINKAAFPANAAAELFVGNWDYARYGVLQGIEYSISEEATLEGVLGEDGKPINLWERDMFAMRATMHVGFMVLKDEAFAVLTPDVTP